jgi:hypothetical protein
MGALLAKLLAKFAGPRRGARKKNGISPEKQAYTVVDGWETGSIR